MLIEEVTRSNPVQTSGIHELSPHLLRKAIESCLQALLGVTFATNTTGDETWLRGFAWYIIV